MEIPGDRFDQVYFSKDEIVEGRGSSIGRVDRDGVVGVCLMQSYPTIVLEALRIALGDHAPPRSIDGLRWVFLATGRNRFESVVFQVGNWEKNLARKPWLLDFNRVRESVVDGLDAEEGMVRTMGLARLMCYPISGERVLSIGVAADQWVPGLCSRSDRLAIQNLGGGAGNRIQGRDSAIRWIQCVASCQEALIRTARQSRAEIGRM